MVASASKATEEASKVPAPAESKSSKKATAYVEYIPPNAAYKERVIKEADWKTVGVEDGKDRVWNDLNGKRIPESEFSDAELDYLERDGGFRIVDA